MIANKRLSKDAIESIEDFSAMLKESKVRAEVNIDEEHGGTMWGVHIKYFDPEGILASEERFLTMKGATRRVAAFVTVYDPKGVPIDHEWSAVFLPEPSKTISEFAIAVLEDLDGVVGQGFAPSILTQFVLELEESCNCDDDSCSCGDDDDEGVDDEDEADDSPGGDG